MTRAARNNLRYPLVPGIVGGLGPFAHVYFERRLLELAAERFGAAGDEDYPEWVVSSIPATPERSAALLGKGPDPTGEILRSMRRLRAAGCDFAAIACNTAHAFLPALAGRLPLPVVHAVVETAAAAAGGHPGVRRYGLLATSGTCRSGIFQRAFAARGVEVVCPPEAEGSAGNVQERLVMAAIFGRVKAGRRVGGIKGGDVAGPRTLLLKAARDLIDRRGAEGLIVGCSEISLAIEAADLPVPLVDSMEVLAGAVLDLAAGRRKLADLPPPAAWPAGRD